VQKRLKIEVKLPSDTSIPVKNIRHFRFEVHMTGSMHDGEVYLSATRVHLSKCMSP